MRHMTEPTTSTGLGLKLARVRLRVRQRPIASAMGVSVSRVAAIEREAVVTDATRDRYLDALTRAAHAREAVA
jgi:transcriptional regulator with XRE-family HTH domain